MYLLGDFQHENVDSKLKISLSYLATYPFDWLRESIRSSLRVISDCPEDSQNNLSLESSLAKRSTLIELFVEVGVGQ